MKTSTKPADAATPCPLQGVKVLELGSLIAGPYAGRRHRKPWLIDGLRVARAPQ
jgi:hypothetical protein